MENITAEVIVDLYAKYQLFHYWQGMGTTLAVIFGILFIFVFLSSLVSDDAGICFIFSFLTLGLLIVGLIIRWKNLYQIEVILKPEISRHVVPAGLDIADKVSQEVLAVWDLLKGVLSK